jgi:hypothetical protein
MTKVPRLLCWMHARTHASTYSGPLEQLNDLTSMTSGTIVAIDLIWVTAFRLSLVPPRAALVQYSTVRT